MNTRFVTSILLGLGGGFVVVASQAFAAGTIAWLAFGIGIGLLLVALTPAMLGERRLVALGLDGLTAALAAWTIVASMVFTGTLVTWLSFAEGLGFVAAMLGGLVLNQVRIVTAAHRSEAILHRETVPAHWVEEHRSTTPAG